MCKRNRKNIYALFLLFLFCLTQCLAKDDYFLVVSRNFDNADTQYYGPAFNTYFETPQSQSETFYPKSLKSYGTTLGWNIWRSSLLTVDLTATYNFPSTINTPYTYNYFNIQNGPAITGAGTAQLRKKSIAGGAIVGGRRPFDWGFGLEIRSENLQLQDYGNSYSAANNASTVSAVAVRPWVDGYIGYTFRTGSVCPTVSLKVSFPWWNYAAPSDEDSNSAHQLVQSLAPHSEFSINAGVRF